MCKYIVQLPKHPGSDQFPTYTKQCWSSLRKVERYGEGSISCKFAIFTLDPHRQMILTYKALKTDFRRDAKRKGGKAEGLLLPGRVPSMYFWNTLKGNIFLDLTWFSCVSLKLGLPYTKISSNWIYPFPSRPFDLEHSQRIPWNCLFFFPRSPRLRAQHLGWRGDASSRDWIAWISIRQIVSILYIYIHTVYTQTYSTDRYMDSNDLYIAMEWPLKLTSVLPFRPVFSAEECPSNRGLLGCLHQAALTGMIRRLLWSDTQRTTWWNPALSMSQIQNVFFLGFKRWNSAFMHIQYIHATIIHYSTIRFLWTKWYWINENRESLQTKSSP